MISVIPLLFYLIAILIPPTDIVGPLDMMRKNASRMRVVSIYDLSASESMRALRHLRRQNLQARSGGKEVEVESDEILNKVYQRVGGRTSYLSKVSRADDMLGTSLPLEVRQKREDRMRRVLTLCRGS